MTPAAGDGTSELMKNKEENVTIFVIPKELMS